MSATLAPPRSSCKLPVAVRVGAWHAGRQRRVAGLRWHFRPLPWLAALMVSANAAATAETTEATVAAAAEGEAARARAFAQPVTIAGGLADSPASLPETAAAAVARQLPTATCAGGAEIGSLARGAEVLDRATAAGASQNFAQGWGVASKGQEGSVPSASGISAAELRAVYLELALRERLSAASRERAGGANVGGVKRLRPVSFTLRENHGGRNLSLPPPVTPLESATSSLRSALSFLRSSLSAM